MRKPRNVRRSARKLFRQLLKIQGNRCAECGGVMDVPPYYLDGDQLRASIDHKVPISEGGSNAWTNLELTHVKCNGARNDRRQPKNGQPKNCQNCRRPSGRRRFCRVCRRHLAFLFAGVGIS